MAIAEVAERTGYGSASAFSTAFSRHVGQPPGRYASPARIVPDAPPFHRRSSPGRQVWPKHSLSQGYGKSKPIVDP
jgi:AraC-like DNA-binding protein